ncbi:MAG: hypothetical protein LBS61_03005 [Endomicrobium sp.]|jgi:hypothetical protein|nr:hypothetical protein [Endomicrobium sp.]
MRGRQSINPLTKFGFALIDNGIVKITELGNKLIDNMFEIPRYYSTKKDISIAFNSFFHFLFIH